MSSQRQPGVRSYLSWSNGVAKGTLRSIRKTSPVSKWRRSFFSKSCTLTLTDGSKHKFDYGAMNIDKVVAAIEVR